MKKYLLGVATGVAAAVLAVKYKEEIHAYYDSLLAECELEEKCKFCFCKK
ncbi:hypothetical protein P4679_22835 [Priestia megaterium]|nr:hypothetical protein [Priestia megaterium]